MQPALDPTGARSDGRQGQAVVLEQMAQLASIDRSRGGRKDLDGVEAQFPGLATGGGQVVPEYERPAARLIHQADRHR